MSSESSLKLGAVALKTMLILSAPQWCNLWQKERVTYAVV